MEMVGVEGVKNEEQVHEEDRVEWRGGVEG